MAVVEIPVQTTQTPNWIQSVILDKTEYQFAFIWSETESAWIMSIYSANKTLVIGGLRLYPAIDLLAPYRNRSTCPQGVLWVDDTQQDLATASALYEALGTRYKLLYREV
jgi:hypothetical protein